MVKWQLLYYISATNNSLKWIISVYVWSICYFTFSRLWLSPFLSNLQRLESTTVKLPKHLASPCPWGSLFLAQHWLLWWVFQRPVGMSQMSTMLESLSGLLANPLSCGFAHRTNTYHSPPVSCGVVTLSLLSSLDFMPAHCSHVIMLANLFWPGGCWLSDSLFCRRVIWLHATFCFQVIKLRYVDTSEQHYNILAGLYNLHNSISYRSMYFCLLLEFCRSHQCFLFVHVVHLHH